MFKPFFRSVKYRSLLACSENILKINRVCNQSTNIPIAFFIGCGRSGTTILGRVFSCHPQVKYLFEPYHLWATIDPRTDVLNLFYPVEPCLFMSTNHVSNCSQIRFNKLIRGIHGSSRTKLIIEKTPLNALRISYLDTLAPGAKFVHIVRDGVDVCQSIDKLANTNSYKIAGKPELNQWWGVNNVKWEALIKEGTAAGYYAKDIHFLNNHLSMAAYEWLVTIKEIELGRAILGDRLKEITYDALTTDPKFILKSLCEFFKIDSPQRWLNNAASAINFTRHNTGKTLSLPKTMCQEFNHYQERYRFSNRAVYLE